MHPTPSRFASAFSSLAMLLATTACGGGGSDAPDTAPAAAPDAGRATALALRRPAPPPPPPAPATDATLALASASASGQAARGSVCGVSADGGKVLFSSGANNLVGGDTDGAEDLFLKTFNGDGIARVVTGTPFCLALTPDANTVVYTASAPSIFPPIRVKNLSTGVDTVVTPPLGTYPNVAGYQFAGVSDDGLRVAFIAQPTSSCSGYNCVALGPARMLLRDLATGQLINLESQVRLSTSQGVADGNAKLSPNGRTIAFSTYAPYPELGDSNVKNDIFAVTIESGAVRLVSSDATGRPIVFTGYFLGGPAFGVQDFLANGTKIAFRAGNDTDAGPAGIYVKDLTSGALTRVLAIQGGGGVVGNRAQVSFSDDGRRAAYVAVTAGSSQTSVSTPTVVDLATGALLNAATLSNGTVGNGQSTVTALLSRDGNVAAFDNNSTNLLGGQLSLGGSELRAYRKLLP